MCTRISRLCLSLNKIGQDIGNIKGTFVPYWRLQGSTVRREGKKQTKRKQKIQFKTKPKTNNKKIYNPHPLPEEHDPRAFILSCACGRCGRLIHSRPIQVIPHRSSHPTYKDPGSRSFDLRSHWLCYRRYCLKMREAQFSFPLRIIHLFA